jgi:hypothetical protein
LSFRIKLTSGIRKEAFAKPHNIVLGYVELCVKSALALARSKKSDGAEKVVAL